MPTNHPSPAALRAAKEIAKYIPFPLLEAHQDRIAHIIDEQTHVGEATKVIEVIYRETKTGNGNRFWIAEMCRTLLAKLQPEGQG